MSICGVNARERLSKVKIETKTLICELINSPNLNIKELINISGRFLKINRTIGKVYRDVFNDPYDTLDGRKFKKIVPCYTIAESFFTYLFDLGIKITYRCLSAMTSTGQSIPIEQPVYFLRKGLTKKTILQEDHRNDLINILIELYTLYDQT